MVSLLYLHMATLVIIGINFLILNRSLSNDLASKYFLINYIYHNHSQIKNFMLFYPFVIIIIYFLLENIIPIGAFFIAVLHLFFIYELISRKNILNKQEYISWYKKNVKHSFSMHAHDILRKNFSFLSQKINRLILFKFEVIFFIVLVIESELIFDLISMIDK